MGRFQFTGQAWLGELALYYYKARIYSPFLGRFLQTDPIGYESELNLYSYVGNDPANLSDPLGLEVYDCTGGLGKGNCVAGTELKKGDEVIAMVDGKKFLVEVSGKGVGQISTPVEVTGSRILSNQQVGNIIFNEARSFSGEKADALDQALAGAVMNADAEYGNRRAAVAGTASSTLDESRLTATERDRLSDVRNNVSATAVLRLLGWDVTKGATHFHFSGSPNFVHVGQNPIYTVGPFLNSFTFGDTKCAQCYANFYDIP